ncbi:MAG: nucleotidyltransferase family protein [Clostridia bacterium]|nr:nucleotidyltransferase family protein [Clostridia bacterium]
MSDFAIICEFNPLHRGHQYLIEQARKMGADRVVCVMSGAAVQRGSLAVTDPYVRAESAIRAGADLVLELPFPWSAASAEQFARGGVAIASQVADTLMFGSECGDLPLLKKAASLAADETFRESYRQNLSEGVPAAEAYYRLLEGSVGSPLSSNDLLGMEYLRAIVESGVNMKALTVKRNGAAYGQTELSPDVFPSATGIRALWEKGDFEGATGYLPEGCARTYRQAFECGAFVSEKKLESLILGWFRLHEGDDFEKIAGAESGLCRRFCSVASEVTSLEEFYEKIRTKRYTDAHIRRTLLYCLLGVLPEDLSGVPQYTTLLAANERGRAILSEKRKSAALPIVTKPTDAPSDTAQYRLTEKLNRLYSLATERTETGGALLKKTPFIL